MFWILSYQLASQSEDKFKKMKDVYGKLREEHIQLLRSESEKKKSISTLNEKIEQVSGSRAFLDLSFKVNGKWVGT
jgi:hypothetical protein